MNQVFIFDSQDRVLKLSDDLRSLLGYPVEKSKRFEWQSLVVEDSSRFKPEPGEAAVKHSVYLKRETGEILEATLRSERLDDSHDLFIAEVTLAKAERDKAATADGDRRDSLEFLTTVSHELRVALNGVIGFASVLGSTSLDLDQLAILEKLQSCNHMLKGLINDILEYSRVATSKIDLKVETVSLNAFVSEVVGLFRERARKKGLELKLESDESVARKVALPKLRVTQVLSNLIANAIKFTESGWVCVRVSCDDSQVCIDVQDTGPGIDENEGESIFRPFVQVSSRGDAAEGSGLGLAISKELVEKMGGSLRLTHPAAGGSRFEIRLPMSSDLPADATDPVSDKPVAKKVDAQAQSRPAREAKRILIVEDNQLNADILGHFLQDYGVKYDHVDNGRAAVELYEDGKYDLILMDVMLPEMNGYEATEKILARSNRKPSVPIVGVTAKVFRRDQLRCLDAGMVEVVHKPVDFKQLREVLDLYLYSKGYERADRLEDLSDVEGVEDLVEDRESATADAGLIESDCLEVRTLEEYIERMKATEGTRNEVVDTAIGIVDAEVGRLVESIDGGDRKEISMRAHSLKGALALLGARNILDLAKGLEVVAGDAGNTLRGEHWKTLILEAYQEFRSELEEYMQATTAK